METPNAKKLIMHGQEAGFVGGVRQDLNPQSNGILLKLVIKNQSVVFTNFPHS